MIEIILKYVSVFLSSMVKFIAGPIFGVAHDLTVVETAAFTILGMMTTVLIIMLVGGRTRNWLIRVLKLEKKFSSSSQRLKNVWEKYGVQGIAFLTPVVLTPIGGSMIAIMLGGSRKKIVKYMLASAIFWGFTISFLFEKVGTAFFGL